MATETVPFTKAGFETLKEELHRLKFEERPKVIQEIADARSHGDLSENAEYHAAKEKQGFVEARIADLDDKLSRGQIIDFSGDDSSQVRFGAFVTITDEESDEVKTYQIVGDLEADMRQNKISHSSPIARALLGKKADDLVEITIPKGTVEYRITDVKY